MVGGVCDGEDYDIIQGIIIRKSGRPIFYVMDSVEVLTRYPPSISSRMAALNYVVSTTVYYNFTNSAILTWILGFIQIFREIHDLGFVSLN